MRKNTTKMLRIIPGVLLLLALLAAIPSQATAGDGDKLEFSFNTWQTVGRTIWSHDAS